MLTVKARIPPRADDSPLVPVAIPDRAEINNLANHLHTAGKPWKGEIFGWQAEYTPERRKKPLGSKMRFTPAEFEEGRRPLIGAQAGARIDR